MTTIGSSDLDVFPLNLGGNTFGWTSDADASFAVLDAFVAGGGNFIDTADVYSVWAPGNSGGESEAIIGQWLEARGARDSVVIATKVSKHPQFEGLSAATIAAAADASLQRLGTDRIDLYYAHAEDASVPLEETAAAFDELVTAGKIRYIGISNFRAERAAEWLSIAEENGFAVPVALQPNYSLVERAGYETTLEPFAVEKQLGVMPYYSLASGFLTGKYRSADDLGSSPRGAGVSKYVTPEGLGVVGALDAVASAHGVALSSVALAWLRSQAGIVAPIASASSASQVADLLAGGTLELSAEEIVSLDEASVSFA